MFRFRRFIPALLVCLSTSFACERLLPDEGDGGRGGSGGSAATGGTGGVDPKQALPQKIKLLSRGDAPHVALGDVDDDGDVDTQDRELLSAAITSGSTATLGCEAAADLTMNGEVDQLDLARFDQVIGGVEQLEAPMLFAQPALPCGYASAVVAATPDARPGQTLRIQLLGDIDANSVIVKLSGIAAEWWVSAKDTISVSMPEVFAQTDSLVLLLGLPKGGHYVYAPRLTTVEVPVPEEDKPPEIHGEEIGPVCPQRGQGCQALILDFSENTYFELDADHLPPLFDALDCSLRYVTPKLVVVPTALFTYQNLLGTVQVLPPDPADVQAARAQNQGEWQTIWNALSEHREAVRAGRDLAFAMVNGHGDEAFDCGTVGPGFDSGTRLHRRFWHRDDYAAAVRNVCTHVAQDMTCYAHLTPKAIDQLNNSGDASCGIAPPMDHAMHAGYDADVASGAVPSGTCSNIAAGARIDEIASVLRAEIDARTAEGSNAPPAGDYERLGQRFRTETLMRGPSGYIDSGYAACAPDEHVSNH